MKFGMQEVFRSHYGTGGNGPYDWEALEAFAAEIVRGG